MKFLLNTIDEMYEGLHEVFADVVRIVVPFTIDVLYALLVFIILICFPLWFVPYGIYRRRRQKEVNDE